jgi:hypothetical protein
VLVGSHVEMSEWSVSFTRHGLDDATHWLDVRARGRDAFTKRNYIMTILVRSDSCFYGCNARICGTLLCGARKLEALLRTKTTSAGGSTPVIDETTSFKVI